MIGRTFAHFRVVERLGAGSMGEVYKARDEHLDRDVAIKVLPSGIFGDESSRRQFRREAEALSRLNHPHIATVHDFDSAGGVDFLVMEYVPGPTLAEHIGGRPLAERAVVTIGGDIAAALEEAHERGVVHRDLKPANVIVTPKGRVKVLDFGIAQLSGAGGDADRTMTRTSPEFAGTLPYMAPEQVQGGPVDARTDVYALGVVLFEMATGRRPFDESHTGRLVDAILHAPLAAPRTLQPRLNPELERIVLKCLERNPEDRYQSAKELAIDLRRLASPTMTQPAPVIASRRGTHARPVAIGAVALIVVAAGAGLWLWRGGGRGSAAPLTPERIASIVALPSQVTSGTSDAFLTDAIPNTLSAHLAEVQGLETKVPPSSVEVDRVSRDLGRLADAYGVSAFVLSSVVADTDRLVLNVQLVDARTRRLLWSREFEGQRGAYLALARGAAEALRGAVRPSAAPVGPPRGGTSSSEAELAYQRGMHHFNRYNNQHELPDFEQAMAAFKQALSLDPQLADAAAAIGWLYEFRIEAGEPLLALLPDVRHWAKRALALDERCSRAWALLAFVEMVGVPPQPRASLEFGLRAIAEGPRDAFAANAVGIALTGASASLALEAFQESSRIDPLYLYPPLNASETLAYLNRADEALAYADAVLRLEPDMPAALIRKALALVELRRPAEAAAVASRLAQQVKEGRVDPLWYDIVNDGAMLVGGSAAERQAALDRLERQALNPGPFSEYPRYYVWLLQHGRTQAALTALEQRARHARVPYDFLLLTPEFKALGGNDQYARVLAIVRAQLEDTIGLLQAADGRGQLPDYLRQALASLMQRTGLSDGRRASAAVPAALLLSR